MDPQFWHERWQAGQVGFHLDAVNPRLLQHWPAIAGAEGAGRRVLVPLCGKTHDLRWLRDYGHQVLGVELSPIACAAFFAERGWQAEVTEERAGVVRWRGLGDGPDGAHGIELLQADLFALADADIGAVDLLYDRASTIALPPTLRPKLWRRLAAWLPPTAQGLLVTLDYPQGEKEGPPFAVPAAEVHALCDEHFEARQISDDDLIARDGDARWPLSRLHELCFALRRWPAR